MVPSDQGSAPWVKSLDAVVCPASTLSDLDPKGVLTFLRQAGMDPVDSPANTFWPNTLETLGLTHRGIPTNAALLLFGHHPQRFFASSTVACRHFHGTEPQAQAPFERRYNGTVFNLVEESLGFVMSKIDRRVGTRSHSAQAPVTYEIPMDAVLEAIVNAVTHCDYAATTSIQVMLFSDRLEVWNPGGLSPGLTSDGLDRPHVAIPRNPLLAGAMRLAGYADSAGVGVPDMIDQCRQAGLPKPRFGESRDMFVQTIFRNDKTSEDVRRIPKPPDTAGAKA